MVISLAEGALEGNTERLRAQRPGRLRKRYSAMILARSAPEGDADEIGAISDIAARRSGVGAKPT